MLPPRAACARPCFIGRGKALTGEAVVWGHVAEAERVDAARALEVLPGSTPLRSLLPFFESSLQKTSEMRKNLQISKALHKADHVKVCVRVWLRVCECLQCAGIRMTLCFG